MQQNPIAIFDSGVGGLSILKSIQARLPHENLIYFADLKYLPYGDKSQDVIQQRVIQISQYLVSQGAKAIVVACNTATVSAISLLRQQFCLPIIGIEPGVKPAGLHTKSGKIGVLATTRTIQSQAFHELLGRLMTDFHVELQACPGLVDQVEKYDLDGPETKQLLSRYIEPLIAKGVDTLVLGCTHYPFLSPCIRSLVGEHIQIIETGAAVAKQVAVRLEQAQLLNPSQELGQLQFFSSDSQGDNENIMSQLLELPVELTCCPLT